MVDDGPMPSVNLGRFGTLRVAALGAVAFDVLFVGHHLLQGFGPEGTSPAEIAAYNTSHATALLVSELLVGLALLAAIVFIAGLAAALRDAGQSAYATAVTVSGAVFVTIGFGSQAAETALVHVADQGDSSAVLALNELQGRTPVVWTIVALTASASWGARRAGLVPRWFGLAGLGAAAVFLLGSMFSTLGRASEGSSSLFGVGLFVLWMLVIAVLLWRRRR
jgi:hypothetical protein